MPQPKIKPHYAKVILAAAIPLLISCGKTEKVDLRERTLTKEEIAPMVQAAEGGINATLSPGLKLSLWAVDSLVYDPISIQVTDDGSLYYTRTNRQKNSEFDIRGHQEWEIPSISLQTIEEKRAFLQKTLSPEMSDKNTWLADVNGDGSHDWRDMTVEREEVFRLEDRDGDGLAEYSQIMVQDFSDVTNDVAGALLKLEDNLFVGVGPDLWRLSDKNGDGVMDEKESISHGYGVHIGFGGHGMSGLKQGPDGRIYWGIGDIGFNGVGPDGTEWKYPNRGVVVRANPDGSDFEVFAMGVRNTHEFTFDAYNNLISVDNDGDHGGESERLVYLVNGSDTGWRTNWQFGKYRDPDNNTYKVWMDEKLYIPRHEGQAAYITPPIQNYINGPTGMVYNPGTALAEKWKNTFFVASFVGNPTRSGIHAFKLEPDGASFKMTQTENIMSGVLATGLDFGPDGSLYFADWIDGWNTKNYGRVWKIEDEGGANWEARKITAQVMKTDFKTLKDDALAGYLSDEDMRIRRKAQFELAKRGEKGMAIFKAAIAQKSNQYARIHGIVGISQLARMEKMDYADELIPLLKDQDFEIRAQAAKWLGDIKYAKAGDALLPLLSDSEIRVRFFASEALGRIAYEPAINGLIGVLEANNDEDAFLRHAASLALARINKKDPILALSSHPSNAVRLGAVLALRRMVDPGIAAFLADEDEYIVTEAARAINDDFSIEGALPALGDLLVSTSFENEPLIRRAINANLRVGTQKAMDNLKAYIAKPGVNSVLKAEAIATLGTWAKPSVLDRVDGRNRGAIERDLAPIQSSVKETLIGSLNDRNEEVRVAGVKAIGKLKIADAESKLVSLLRNDQSENVRVAAILALSVTNPGSISEPIEIAMKDKSRAVRVVGLDLLTKTDISQDLMVSLLQDVIQNRTTAEKQAALLSLGNLENSAELPLWNTLLDDLSKDKLPNEVMIELEEAIDSTGSADLKTKYATIQEERTGGDLVALYSGALEGGSVRVGRNIFFQNQTAQCIRCHGYDDMGGVAGPHLNGIANRVTKTELLEALIDPSKRLAPGYGIVQLELKDGTSVSGTLMEEQENGLLVKVGAKPDTLIMNSSIAERKNSPSSMPDMKALLSKREIRDLLSFLSTMTKEWE
ncbi:putative membrane-bound dehydrogenase domain-containing protein [Algoriphagus locisalis]|uniref:Putative membrane-bound dehydrogenase domain-containing protein n=1 Tax=Algoriphagus locisalis TaxID=305507 RepID=A0A1I6YJ08_9BACT|nr:HEAT repeat domain-containing protein [Algoriphagus locisalis]SFT50337.1 putative membrane-bound dehydrogenase domain-containing protein [Algoriphagus locisalis]